MQRWREATRLELIEDGASVHRGFLQPDVDRYLERLVGRASYQAERSHAEAWIHALGNVPRNEITAEAVARTMARWQAEGLSVLTVLHRWRVLRAIYRTLDGPKAKTPCDTVHKPKRPRPTPLRVSLETMRTVAENLKAAGDPKTYARFLVLASTGQRPVQLQRTTPDMVDLKRRAWAVPVAKGGTFRYLYLTDDALAAWRLFIDAEAWGPYDTRQHAKRLRKAGWPEDVRPYNIRHTLAMDLLDSGADLSDIQTVLGHAFITTTRASYAGIAEARVAAALARVDGRLGLRGTASLTASRRSARRSTLFQNPADRATGQNGPKVRRESRSSGDKTS